MKEKAKLTYADCKSRLQDNSSGVSLFKEDFFGKEYNVSLHHTKDGIAVKVNDEGFMFISPTEVGAAFINSENRDLLFKLNLCNLFTTNGFRIWHNANNQVVASNGKYTGELVINKYFIIDTKDGTITIE